MNKRFRVWSNENLSLLAKMETLEGVNKYLHAICADVDDIFVDDEEDPIIEVSAQELMDVFDGGKYITDLSQFKID